MRSKKEIVKKLGPLFESTREVELAYLFGSAACERPTPISDVDVAVYLNDKIDLSAHWRLRVRLIGQVMDTLGTDSVDLVILNECPILLRHEVLKNGVLLYCQHPGKRIEFVTNTIREYCDTSHLRDFHMKAAKERLSTGAKRGSTRSFTQSLERVRRLFDET
ncbi:MAG: nucleotidyltransferase domain-containing protein [bacterium]